MNDTTRRFLHAIVDKIPSGGEIVELRLFPAIKQGGMESGVAVVAVLAPEPIIAAVVDELAWAPENATMENVVAPLPAEPLDESVDKDDSPYAEPEAEQELLELEGIPAPAPLKRYAMLTARYRLVLKGPDRGKWEMELTHEADAPLATLERVARGVSKRAGEETDPEHFSGSSLRSALDAPAWITAT